MSAATLETSRVAAPDLATPPLVGRPVAKGRLPFSRRTLLAVGAAVAIAAGGALYIAAPKGSVSTDAAYVQADNSVVAPKVRGLVAEVLVRHNQAVKKGDPLIRIDPEEFDARVGAASADLQNAEAGVQSAKAALISLGAEEKLAAANVRAAQTSIRSADAQNQRADADRKRYENLVASGAVARRDADTFRAAAVTAQSDADHSRAELEVSRNQASVVTAKRATLEAVVAQSQAAVARAESTLVLARQDQDHTLIRAPIDGVVGDRQVEPGAKLSTSPLSFTPGSGSQFSLLPFEPGTGNFTKIVQRIPVRIRFDPSQNGLERLRPGLSATVSVRLVKNSTD
jgi:membrane fusion protein (multidrug efflux system)